MNKGGLKNRCFCQIMTSISNVCNHFLQSQGIFSALQLFRLFPRSRSRLNIRHTRHLPQLRHTQKNNLCGGKT
jgi:hypothetical protein